MSLSQIKVTLERHWGSDRNAAEAAWASTGKAEGRSDEDVRRVVGQLVALSHDTPKESVWLDFAITCPIFVERQIDKYRMSVQHQDFRLEYLEAPFGRWGMTQNELSGRYRTLPDRPYEMPKDVAEISAKATKHRVVSSGLVDGDVVVFAEGEQTAFSNTLKALYETYQFKLTTLKEAELAGKITNAQYKRAREVWRGILGTAFLTDMRLVLNLNAFEHLINQRLAADAQMESRVVAVGMLQAVEKDGVATGMVFEMAKKNGWGPCALKSGT
jgi:thymidylate synthase ThyX